MGDRLSVSGPSFALEPAERYLFIAEGIGIIPIRSMVATLRRRGGARIDVVYLSRSRNDMPFLEEFALDGTLIHHSATNGRLDLWPFLAEPDDDRRIHCCGPNGLIDEVRSDDALARAPRACRGLRRCGCAGWCAASFPSGLESDR